MKNNQLKNLLKVEKGDINTEFLPHFEEKGGRLQLTISIFGSSQRGLCGRPCHIRNETELVDTLGDPPPDGLGMSIAIQSLIYDRDVVFVRVEEEGFSTKDYISGFKHLEDEHFAKLRIAALALPGVGTPAIIDASEKICQKHRSLLLISEKDFYDYMTNLSRI